jgi:peptidoglycan hydrolase-like protein with peptidoglycan-binding domain
MRLNDIANGATSASIGNIGSQIDLARDVQERLGALGLLDPPADGTFGPVSRWALDAFLAKAKLKAKIEIDREVAQRLMGETADTLFPLNPKADLAGRLIRALQTKGHWIARHPDCVNIVYVEAMDPDGTQNDNAPNQFNDARFVLRITQSGRPALDGAWDATTEPGRFWTQNPMNPGGAARIAFGQYKSWSVGTHNASKASGHEALVQTLEITVHRDLNQDFSRAGDATDSGLFGVNQHWGYDNPKDDIGKAGAGCLVGRTKNGHRDFMKIVKSDPRYVANNSYRFMTAVLSGVDIPQG